MSSPLLFPLLSPLSSPLLLLSSPLLSSPLLSPLHSSPPLSLPPSSPASASSLAHTPLAKQNYLVSRTPLRAIELRAQLELFESTKERMYELQTANKVLLDELSRTRDDAASTLAEVKSMWTAETSVLRQELDAMQKERDEAHDERLTVKEGLRRLEAELSTTKDAYKRADLEARTLREDAKVVEALTIAQNKRIHKRRELEKRLRKELEVEDPLWSHDEIGRASCRERV